MSVAIGAVTAEEQLAQLRHEAEAATSRSRARIAELRRGGAAETSDALTSAIKHDASLSSRLEFLDEALKLVRSVRRRGLVHFLLASEHPKFRDGHAGVQAFAVRALGALSTNDLDRARVELALMRQVVRLETIFCAVVPFVFAGMFWGLSGPWAAGLLLAAWFGPTVLIFRPDQSAKIERLPGSWLLQLLEFVCTGRSFKGVYEPIILDMQEEYVQAVASGRRHRARWIRVRGYWSILDAAGFTKYLQIADLISWLARLF